MPPVRGGVEFLVRPVADRDHLRAGRDLADQTVVLDRRAADRPGGLPPPLRGAPGALDACRPSRQVGPYAPSTMPRRVGNGPSCGCTGTRPSRPGRCHEPASRTSGSLTSRTYLRRPSPADANRTISPTSSSTVRWWASRFDGMPSRSPSSFGDRSLTANSSTMASRAASPSAACIAARAVMSSSSSIDCERVLIGPSPPTKTPAVPRVLGSRRAPRVRTRGRDLSNGAGSSPRNASLQ